MCNFKSPSWSKLFKSSCKPATPTHRSPLRGSEHCQIVGKLTITSRRNKSCRLSQRCSPLRQGFKLVLSTIQASHLEFILRVLFCDIFEVLSISEPCCDVTRSQRIFETTVEHVKSWFPLDMSCFKVHRLFESERYSLKIHSWSFGRYQAIIT